MDNETQRLDSARVPGSSLAPAPETPVPGPGNPTTYLPPVGAAPATGPGPAPAYTTPFPVPPVPPAPSAGPAYMPPAGTTYAAPGAQPASAGPAYGSPGQGPQPMWSRTNQRANGWLPLILIGLGIWALSGRMEHVFGAAIPLALGLIFLYVSTQGPARWGFRIPGAILTGLGAGIVVDTLGLGGEGYSAIGLGLGFVALWAWDRAQWWWLIPGAVITLGGLEGVMSTSGWHTSFLLPLALIAFGAYLFSGRQWRARRP
jgi:hypothetical protein